VPKKASDITHPPKNFLTAPSKKGTYGYAGLHIGCATKAGLEGIAHEYKYESEPLQGRRPRSVRGGGRMRFLGGKGGRVGGC
jgi:hypothetical protein